MRLKRHTLVSIACLVALVATIIPGGTAALAADPPNGSTWFETFIDTPDRQRLHVDVMRPEGFTDEDETPVILIVSPYLGMTSPDEAPGPSNRFNDFFDGADVFARGYSVVMVSLRGTGGSSGCLDILGPGEQSDVLTAVEWARTQPWSTGHVGMYGKSYDANTGLVGAALGPEGLDAVVAQETAPSRYRGSYSDRVRLAQSLVYPSASYGAQGEGMFSLNGSSEYAVNSVSHSADCQVGLAEHYGDDPNTQFWKVRDFVARAKNSRVPTFMTAGYIDDNTNIGAGALDYFNALAGPKRLWIGWWRHERGADMCGEKLCMGRDGFYDEVMRFYDRYLKGLPADEAPVHLDPVIAAQGSDGTWRSEAQWPPTDAENVTAPLLAGSYEDDARNQGSLSSGPGGSPVTFNATTGAGAWTLSPPLEYQAHLGGIPIADVDITPVVPRTNVVVNVYDVDAEGNATMVTRGAGLADSAGIEEIRMWPTDWLFEPGHRIGVLVSGANAEAYTHVPTRTTVRVNGGTIDLPFLGVRRVSNLQGARSPRLDGWLEDAPFAIDAATIEARTDAAFPLPPPQEAH